MIHVHAEVLKVGSIMFKEKILNQEFFASAGITLLSSFNLIGINIKLHSTSVHSTFTFAPETRQVILVCPDLREIDSRFLQVGLK